MPPKSSRSKAGSKNYFQISNDQTDRSIDVESNGDDPMDLSEYTSDDSPSDSDTDYKPKFIERVCIDKNKSIELITDLLAYLKESRPYPATVNRNFGVLIFAILKQYDVNYNKIRNLLTQIGAGSIETAERWYFKSLSSDEDYSGFYQDGRRYNRVDGFYDCFPEIETRAKEFAIKGATALTSDFTTYELTKFVTAEFEKETGISMEDDFIRSESSCRRDLKEWGLYSGDNKHRPYFEGN